MNPAPSLASVWGESLRAARLAAGLTQIELANRISANQHTISRLENGAHRPSDPLKLALAAEFDTTVEALFPYPKPTVAA